MQVGMFSVWNSTRRGRAATLVRAAVLLVLQAMWLGTAVAADGAGPTAEAAGAAPPEWFGDAGSQCAELPEYAPEKTLLLLAAEADEDDYASVIAFQEALGSYLGHRVRLIAPGHYDPVLVEDADALVVLANVPFDDGDVVRQALTAAGARGIPIAWLGLGAENFAEELKLGFQEGEAASVPGIVYNGVAIDTEDLPFAPPVAGTTDPETRVLATRAGSGEPVILRRGDLVYVGFVPFYGDIGRFPFVAAVDAVAGLFGPRQRNRRVLFRLEDISAEAYGPDAPVFSEVTGLLLDRGVFIHIGIIAQDVEQNADRAEERVLQDIGAARNVISLVFGHPGKVEIVQHGFRHFRADERNAGCSMPGCGTEFFEDDEETLGRDAAAALARERLAAGRDLISRHLSEPMVFEAPHYTMAPVQAEVAEDMFPLILHAPWTFGGSPGDFFLPWFTHRAAAAYGPSDIGYIAYDDPLSVDRILGELGDLAGILPDPVVTVFFHPFMQDVEGRGDDLRRLVEGIQGLGYRFVSACGELAR